MALQLAEIGVWWGLGYVAIGVLFALVSLARGTPAWAPKPVTITWPARLLVMPGALLLWPWLTWRWLGQPSRRA